jgi:hypothetical protein
LTHTPSTIALPSPGRTRWQPLRLGLVELYHYDVEEFWFRDGHLMLRGNNGTGKSKVLSLTLPFLLDANLSASRVEPDGDRGKRMEWNLLMNKRYERHRRPPDDGLMVLHHRPTHRRGSVADHAGEDRVNPGALDRRHRRPWPGIPHRASLSSRRG